MAFTTQIQRVLFAITLMLGSAITHRRTGRVSAPACRF